MPEVRRIMKGESRSYKSDTFRTDYRGHVNVRGARLNTAQEQNAPHTGHTGKNLKAPKRHVVSGVPAGYTGSPRYTPGAFTRGMGYADNSGYPVDAAPEIAPEFNFSTLPGLRAARDYALNAARIAESRGNSVAAENARSNARGYRTMIRKLERGKK